MSIKPHITLAILSLLLISNYISFSYEAVIPEVWAQEDCQRDLLAGITFAGGDGGSIDTAVIIKKAKDFIIGTAAEYYYLETKYGGKNVKWNLVSQNLIQNQNRHFDLIRIRLLDGSIKEIYFDITEFFGKM
jgi:hypothetical protein